MAVSVSGLLTLIGIIVSGPLCWGLYFALGKVRGNSGKSKLERQQAKQSAKAESQGAALASTEVGAEVSLDSKREKMGSAECARPSLF